LLLGSSTKVPRVDITSNTPRKVSLIKNYYLGFFVYLHYEHQHPTYRVLYKKGVLI
jgi:hypothetical protein